MQNLNILWVIWQNFLLKNSVLFCYLSHCFKNSLLGIILIQQLQFSISFSVHFSFVSRFKHCFKLARTFCTIRDSVELWKLGFHLSNHFSFILQVILFKSQGIRWWGICLCSKFWTCFLPPDFFDLCLSSLLNVFVGTAWGTLSCGDWKLWLQVLVALSTLSRN